MAEPAMDEMTAVRQLRADAPVPDLARLAPARRRLLDEIEGRPRHGRAGWKLKAAGAVAAVTAAALLSTLTLHEDDRTPAQPVPTATPRPTSWVFHQVRLDTVCDAGMSPSDYSEAGMFQLWPDGKRPCDTKTKTSLDSYRWIRYDGTSTALADRNTDPADVQVRTDPIGPLSREMLAPRETDALLAALPDDPDAALRSILRKSVPTRVTSAWRLTQAQRDFDEVIEVLSGASAVPADKARTIYRIITGLEGATEPAGATDGAGRKVLAIGIDGNFRDYAYERNSMQVLLDPETFAYRGVRWVAGIDYYVGGKASGGPFVAKGTVLGTATRVATVVVDKAGDRN
ncbi:hypothetical protein OHU34_17280 [Streptomyces sp. NBC_00080]|uniref:hypothetical protein n=1 Tax=Streptomyces TaxID=1883 RepID=UPI001150FBE8|nr:MULTISPECIES: hypothetical protein [Streptomyces]TQJ55064.1 hypothetical protein FBY34_2858 [Streptomyces sp. SLBN-115]